MIPAERAFNFDGVPAAGAVAYLYETGTLNPVSFYSDAGLLTPLGTHITANAIGRFPTAYQDAATPFRMRIEDVDGVELCDVDPFYFGSPYNTLISTEAATVANRTAMAAISGQPGASLILSEAGREGLFVFSSADLSTEVAADTTQGIYVAPATDTTGTNGAWVRFDKEIKPHFFGAVGNGTTDDYDALQACFDWFFAEARPTYTLDMSGEFGIDASGGALLFGPTTGDASISGAWSIRGHLRLVSLSTGFELCRLRNLSEQHILGTFSAQGSGATNAFADRLNGVGFALENCGNMKVSGGFHVDKFWYNGITTPVINNDGAQLGRITATYCGSGQTGTTYLLQSAYTGVSNNGLTGAGQRTTFTGIATFPDATIETYATVDNQPIFVRINSEVGYVKSWDRAAGTVDVYPAMDTTLTGAGTLDWVFGCGFLTMTSDGNCIVVDKLKAQNCGIGLGVASLYGPRINQANISSCGIGSVIGKTPNGSCIGTSIDGLYEENNDLHRAYLLNTTTSSYCYINSSFELDLTKVLAINGARDLTNNRLTGQLGGTTSGPLTMLAKNGRILTYHGPSVTKTISATDTFRDHREAPKTRTIFRDSQTVTIEVQDEGYNRLFGFNGATWRYIGTGTNGAPTGTITFNPPSGGTVNGGAVDAGASFSGFSGPAEFTIEHTDKAQLTWVVRPVAGWRLKGSKTFDPPSIAASGTTTTTVTVAGAAMGDAFVPSFSVDLNGLVVTAYVSAADTVTVVFFNPTAGAIDKASGTLTVTRVG